MISMGIFTVFFVAFLCHFQVFAETVDQTPLAATCSAETVAVVFASVFFIDIISAHDPEVTFGLRLPSDIASKRIYDEDLRIFQNKGFRNAEYIASNGAKAMSLTDEFTLPLYYLNVGTTVGEFLADRGLLSCENVIQTATEYFEKEQRVFQSLDSAELEAHEGAIVTGMQDLLEELGHTLEENEVNWQILVDTFNQKYTK